MIRKVSGLIQGKYTYDSAGVKLYKVFGGTSTYHLTDPFLLLDFFGSSNVEDYINGFPWHPHRGIETVTYLLQGKVEHEDSEGNKGVIYPGEAQWMTAGSGIFGIKQKVILSSAIPVPGALTILTQPRR